MVTIQTPAAILAAAAALAADNTLATTTDIALHWARAASQSGAVSSRIAGDRSAIARAADAFLRGDPDIADLAAIADTARLDWRMGDVPCAAANAPARRTLATHKVWVAAAVRRGGMAPLPGWGDLLVAELGFGPSARRLWLTAARAHGVEGARNAVTAPLPDWAVAELLPGEETVAITTALTAGAGGRAPLARAFMGADGQWTLRATGTAFGRLSAREGEELLRAVRDLLR